MGAQRLIRILRRDGISDDAVLAAMAAVPRDLFVPAELRDEAWEDIPLPIGGGQTISQPFVVAYMTEAVAISAGDRVLDVGTGSGYQAAVLAACGGDVRGIERRAELAAQAQRNLAAAGFDVPVHVGDGSRGWPADAPYDVIVVAAATDDVPRELLDQLREPGDGRRGGRLILPLGDSWSQQLVLFTRRSEGVDRRELLGVRFVPLVRAVHP